MSSQLISIKMCQSITDNHLLCCSKSIKPYSKWNHLLFFTHLYATNLHEHTDFVENISDPRLMEEEMLLLLFWQTHQTQFIISDIQWGCMVTVFFFYLLLITSILHQPHISVYLTVHAQWTESLTCIRNEQSVCLSMRFLLFEVLYKCNFNKRQDHYIRKA